MIIYIYIFFWGGGLLFLNMFASFLIDFLRL